MEGVEHVRNARSARRVAFINQLHSCNICQFCHDNYILQSYLSHILFIFFSMSHARDMTRKTTSFFITDLKVYHSSYNVSRDASYNWSWRYER